MVMDVAALGEVICVVYSIYSCYGGMQNSSRNG